MNVEWRCPLRSWLLAGAVALASCAPEQDAASGSATNEARPARAPAETTADKGVSPDSQTAAEIAPPTAEGWGPLHVGMMLVEIMAAAGPDSDPDAVGGPAPESCDIFHPARAPEGLRVMVEDGRLTRVSLSNPTEVKNDRGFGDRKSTRLNSSH